MQEGTDRQDYEGAGAINENWDSSRKIYKGFSWTAYYSLGKKIKIYF